MVFFHLLVIIASLAVAGAIYYSGHRNRQMWKQCRFPTDLDEQKEAYRRACKKYDEMMSKK
jgi:hypothetical protein